MKPNVKFTTKDLDKELIVEMLKRFSLYEISVKFDIRYSSLVNHCIKLKIRKQLEMPKNDRFARADEICRKKGFKNAIHYIQVNGTLEFKKRIKPLIC
jgi:hypothetical protein